MSQRILDSVLAALLLWIGPDMSDDRSGVVALIIAILIIIVLILVIILLLLVIL